MATQTLKQVRTTDLELKETVVKKAPKVSEEDKIDAEAKKPATKKAAPKKDKVNSEGREGDLGQEAPKKEEK